jgi:hypothetical protein
MAGKNKAWGGEPQASGVPDLKDFDHSTWKSVFSSQSLLLLQGNLPITAAPPLLPETPVPLLLLDVRQGNRTRRKSLPAAHRRCIYFSARRR